MAAEHSSIREKTELSIPVLASLHLRETADFYTNYLDFNCEIIGDNYLIATSDSIEIHFWLCSERHIAENTSCYIRTKNVDVFFERFSKNGLKLNAPADRPWGMRELYVIDPHGNLIKIGQRIDLSFSP